MYYTEEEVLDYVKEEDVKFVRLAYFDLSGKQKNATIMASELPRAFENRARARSFAFSATFAILTERHTKRTAATF